MRVILCYVTLVLFKMSGLIVKDKSDCYNREDTAVPEKTCAGDSVDFVPNDAHVTNFDILALIVSIVSHIIDVGLDINIAYRYCHSGQSDYFILTVVFILFPALVNTIISMRM